MKTAPEFFNERYPLGTFPPTRRDIIMLMEDYANQTDINLNAGPSTTPDGYEGPMLGRNWVNDSKNDNEPVIKHFQS